MIYSILPLFCLCRLESLINPLQEFHQKRNHGEISSVLETLSRVVGLIGDSQRSLDLMLEAIEINKMIHGEDSIIVKLLNEDVGVSYKELGFYSKSFEILSVYLEDASEIYGNTFAQGRIYFNLGDLQMQQRKYGEALESLKRSFIIQQLSLAGLNFFSENQEEEEVEKENEDMILMSKDFKPSNEDIDEILQNFDIQKVEKIFINQKYPSLLILECYSKMGDVDQAKVWLDICESIYHEWDTSYFRNDHLLSYRYRISYHLEAGEDLEVIKLFGEYEKVLVLFIFDNLILQIFLASN